MKQQKLLLKMQNNGETASHASGLLRLLEKLFSLYSDGYQHLFLKFQDNQL